MSERIFRGAGTDALSGRALPRTSLSGLLATLVLAMLASVASGQTFDEVTAKLKDVDPRVRLDTMRLLLEAGYVEAAVPIAAVIADPVDDLRRAAIAAEITLLTGRKFSRSRHVAGIVEVRDVSVAESAFRVGPSLGVRAVPPDVTRALIKATRDPNPAGRLEATYALGALTALDAHGPGAADLPAVLEGLSAGLADPDPRQRLASAMVTARLIDDCGRGCGPADAQGVGDAFVHAMNDPDERVRMAAMSVLGSLRYERAVKALDDHVAYYGRGAAAEAALGALARIGHPSSVSLFWSLLSDKDAGIRQYAVEGIGRVGDPSQAGELESAMAHERSDRAELAVVFALQRLGRGQRVDRLVEAVSHSAMREQARGYLIELGSSNAQALTAYLRDPTPDLRAVIADILGRIGDSTIIPALEPLTRDRDPEVALAAERAVARLSRQ